MKSFQAIREREVRHSGNAILAGCLLFCAWTAAAASLDAIVRDKAGSPLSDAIVYAENESGNVAAQPPGGAKIDQVNKEFVPLVTAVQTGTAITFPNKDNIRHHVYSFSPAKKFELKLYSGVPSAPQIFDKPGVVLLGCNIHDWMVAYVLALDTPHFAKTSNGEARIELLPAGDYLVKVWHPQLRGSVPGTRLKVVAGQENTVRFTLDLMPVPQRGQVVPGK